MVYSNKDSFRFALASAIAALAIATDVLDGFLARRWGLASEFGYFLDGLGDKTFYFAFLLIIVREGHSPALLAWILMVREIVLYALRALDINRADNLRRLRNLSRYHALFIRLFFFCILTVDGARFSGFDLQWIVPIGNALGVVAAVLGFLAIFRQTRSIVQES